MKAVYQVITDRIVSLLEEGTVPWHRPWGGPANYPKNLVSGKQYRGINTFLLVSAGYDSPYWLTFKQARSRGGFVKKGEQAVPVIYWNWHEKEDPETGETVEFPFLRYYSVFNTEQCEGIEYPEEAPQNPFVPIEACERIVDGMLFPPEVVHHASRAAYDPSTDSVYMPSASWFESPEAYYAALFHELTHSTGHESRLARKGFTGSIVLGSPTYSKEELVGEMGAAFLCGQAGIEDKVIENSASYIASWLRKLRNDNRFVVHAAAQAQKAADYILEKQSSEESSE